jgi:hypothetical protein
MNCNNIMLFLLSSASSFSIIELLLVLSCIYTVEGFSIRKTSIRSTVTGIFANTNTVSWSTLIQRKPWFHHNQQEQHQQRRYHQRMFDTSITDRIEPNIEYTFSSNDDDDNNNNNDYLLDDDAVADDDDDDSSSNAASLRAVTFCNLLKDQGTQCVVVAFTVGSQLTIYK